MANIASQKLDRASPYGCVAAITKDSKSKLGYLGCDY